MDFLPKPISAEQIYSCLALHLGVEFERARGASEETVWGSWAGPPVRIPGDLYAQLTTAAELHSTTALKRCQQQLRLLGPDGQRLGQHIRHLMRSYDMEGILRLIEAAALPSRGTGQSDHAFATAEEPAS